MPTRDEIKQRTHFLEMLHKARAKGALIEHSVVLPPETMFLYQQQKKQYDAKNTTKTTH